MNDLKKIGQICAKVRREKGYTQLKASFDVGYAPENISSFENGRNDNMRIFLWYLENCVTEHNIVEFINEIKETRERGKIVLNTLYGELNEH